MLRIISDNDPIKVWDICLRELADFSKSQRHRRAFLLVPEEAKADSERRYMESFDRRGLMLAEVLSFRRLAHRIFSEAGGIAGTRIGEQGKALLITRILQEQAEDFPFLARLAGKASYAAELSQIMGDFSRYNITTDALKVTAGVEIPEMSRTKIQELAKLREEFSKLKLELELYDSDEDLARLTAFLNEQRNHPRLKFLATTKIWISGFSLLRALTPQELDLIEVLSSLVEELTLGLCLPEERESSLSEDEETINSFEDNVSKLSSQVVAMSFSLKTLQGLRQRVGKGYIEFPSEEMMSRHQERGIAENNASKGAEKAYDSAVREIDGDIDGGIDRDTDSNPPQRKLELWQSSHSREEIAAVAGEIKRLIGEAGYKRREIAVALCKEEDFDRLSATFQEFELDPFIASARPLDESPLIRYMELFFRLTNPDARIEDLISLARTGLLGQDSPGLASLGQDSVGLDALGLDLWENFILQTPMKWVKQLENNRHYAYYEGGDVARDFYDRYLKPHVDAARKCAQAPNCKAKVEFILRWFEVSSIKQLLETKVLQLEQAGLSERALLLVSAWEALLSILEDAHLLLGESKISDREFGQLILAPLLGQKPQGIPLGLDRIRVGKPGQLLLYPAKVLFIVGADAKSFPPAAPDEGLLQNSEREIIETVSEQVFPNYRRDSLISGAALEYYLLQRGTERLYLSCPSTDKDDLSLLQLELEASGKYEKRVFSEYDVPDVRWLSPVRATRYLNATSESNTTFYKVWHELLKSWFKPKRKDPLLAVTPRIILPENLAKVAIEQIKSISISRLQTFNDCPYKYYGNYVLGLRERPIYQPKSNTLGSFLHAMMEESFYDLQKLLREAASDGQGLAELVSEPNEIAIKQALSAWQAQINHEYCQSLYKAVAGQEDFIAYSEAGIKGSQGSRLIKTLEDTLRFNGVELQDSGYFPHKLEWHFPLEELVNSEDCLCLETGTRKFPLNGLVDRLDRDSAGRVRLFDYKSNKHTLDVKDMLLGKELQLPIYSLAWQHYHPESSVNEIGWQGLYMDSRLVAESDKKWQKALDDRKKTSNRIRTYAQGENSLLNRLGKYALAYGGRIMETIETGEISPAPLTQDGKTYPCTYCEFKDLCHFDERLQKERSRHFELTVNARKREESLDHYLKIFEEEGLFAHEVAAQDTDEGGQA